MSRKASLAGAMAVLLVGACAETEPRALDTPPPVAAVMPEAVECSKQPEIARPQPTAPTCTNPTLRGGQSFHDQLTVQISSGAFAVMDCPRMRIHGQDAPICVAREVGGRIRGACCPPGHTDPTDPACVAEGSLDAMFARNRVWEWCRKDAPPRDVCDPCVWVTGAER